MYQLDKLRDVEDKDPVMASSFPASYPTLLHAISGDGLNAH